MRGAVNVTESFRNTVAIPIPATRWDARKSSWHGVPSARCGHITTGQGGRMSIAGLEANIETDEEVILILDAGERFVFYGDTVEYRDEDNNIMGSCTITQLKEFLFARNKNAGK
jgi:hypothetical protein